MTHKNLVVALLRDPQCAHELDLADWDLLIRQSRRADLLGRVSDVIEIAGLMELVPMAPRRHLESARLLHAAQSRAVRREVAYVVEALTSLRMDIILLKGAAYLIAGLPANRGRMFADIDILVPHERIAEVESELMLKGWIGSHRHPYDQRYYRQWMHEIPPMQHIDRLTTIDVHHAILPVTARIQSNATAIINDSVSVDALKGVRVLAPADMVLHSATHLYFNEEFSHGLRDLSDLDILLRHFGQTPLFWEHLQQRSRYLNLEKPLHFCLNHAFRVFGTPVPRDILESTNSRYRANIFHRIVEYAWRCVLQPPHASLRKPSSALAEGVLLLRSHWLKMPMHLLIYHLLSKALRRDKNERDDTVKV